jgi:hypothetical protein
MTRGSLGVQTADLLDRWSDQALQAINSRQVHTANERAAISRGTLKFPPEPPTMIVQLEERLGLVLPESYRAFLEATNGFLHPAIDGRFLSVAEVDRFANIHRDQAKILSDGGTSYNIELTEATSRSMPGRLTLEQIMASIAVSEVESGQFFCLLAGESRSPRQPIAFAFDFWGLPRLYESFTNLLLDEMDISLEVLRG